MAAVPSTGRASEVERSAAAPEADATRALYERYAGQLYGFCLHRLGSREEAEDAVQTTFLNAFRGLRRGVVPEAESAWLFKIAENVCLTRHRSAWRRGRVESPSDMQAIQDLTPARERDGDELMPLGDALAAMPETQRRAILLREWQGLSYKEIADEMDVSQSAVETLIFRARRSLANALETPWQDRRSAGRAAGRRAFDLGSLLAGLKTLFAGGAAAKVAVLAVAATGVAALAVADTRDSAPAFEEVAPSATALRAPDSAVLRRRPAVAAGSDRSESRAAAPERRLTRGAPVSTASPKAGGVVVAGSPEHGRTESEPPTTRPSTPASGAEEPESRTDEPTPAARVESTTTATKPKVRPKPKQKAKAKASRPKSRPASANAKSTPKPKEPKAEQPKPEPKPVTPAPPPAPPAEATPPSEKDKDKEKPA